LEKPVNLVHRFFLLAIERVRSSSGQRTSASTVPHAEAAAAAAAATARVIIIRGILRGGAEIRAKGLFVKDLLAAISAKSGKSASSERIKNGKLCRAQPIVKPMEKSRDGLDASFSGIDVIAWAAMRIAVGSAPSSRLGGASFARRRQLFLDCPGDLLPPLLAVAAAAAAAAIQAGEGEGESAAPPLEKPVNLASSFFPGSASFRH